MIAFVAFVQSYAIWLYLLSLLGILLGIKMLSDARRLARTTLFSLEQERAGEQSYRAITLIVVFVLIIAAVTVVNTFVGPVMPKQEGAILRGSTPTLPAYVFPSQTPIPSLTPTLAPPTETPFVTTTPGNTPTRTPRPTVVTTPSAVPFPTGVPAPIITGPNPNGGTWIGEAQKNNNLIFQWTWSCGQCVLGPNDRFVVTISYVDKFSGGVATVGGGTRDNMLSLGRILSGGPFEMYQKAKEDTYQWYVQVKSTPNDQPVSPPSDTWKFVWK